MSQAKVEHYKEQKRNRQKIMKKEKTTRRLEITLIVVVLAALFVWFGFQVNKNMHANDPIPVKQLDLIRAREYMDELRSLIDEAATGDETPTDTAATSAE